ncbi:TIGR02391 family protein [Dyella lutea]|uniref:TIGR02391 family protein n=1 Tax=Dyella lutea TaxID=2950441 RepID=UPI003CCD7FF6
MPEDVRRLFDNGHYAQATFEALKYLDEEVQRISGDSDFGKSLMMRVFGGVPPKLRLNPGMTASEQSEQEGFKFIFAGTMAGIRNPRGHKSGVVDDPDTCLDHLSLTSMLLRKIEEAGLR